MLDILKERAEKVNKLLIECFKEKPRQTAEAINMSKKLKVSLNGKEWGIIPDGIIETVELRGLVGSVICCPQEDIESNFVRELLFTQSTGPAGEGEKQVRLDIFEEELEELKGILNRVKDNRLE